MILSRVRLILYFLTVDLTRTIGKAAAEEYYTRATLHLAEPVYSGDYPVLLKKLLGNKLPEFTSEESKLLKGSSDFFGLNHYTSFFVHKRKNPIPDADFRSTFLGEDVEETSHGPDGVEIAPEAGLSWVRPVPWGFKKLLIDLWKRYGKDIWVTEVSHLFSIIPSNTSQVHADCSEWCHLPRRALPPTRAGHQRSISNQLL